MKHEPRHINDYEAFSRGLRNYTWLQSVIPGASDLDFITERRRKFLVLEAKHWHHGVRVPIGQDILLRQLDGIRAHAPGCQAQCTGCGEGERPFTVLLVGEEVVGEDEDADRFHVMRFGRAVPLHSNLYPSSLFDTSTRDDLRHLVHTWEVNA